MDSTFEDFEFNCNVSLNSFIKKENNRKTIAKMLCRIANQDPMYANYLCLQYTVPKGIAERPGSGCVADGFSTRIGRARKIETFIYIVH